MRATVYRQLPRGGAVALACLALLVAGARAGDFPVTQVTNGGALTVTLKGSSDMGGSPWLLDNTGKNPPERLKLGAWGGYLAVTPDGTSAVIATGKRVSVVTLRPRPTVLACWDDSHSSRERKLDLKGTVGAVAVSPDGKVVAVGNGEHASEAALRKVVLLDVGSGKHVRSFECGESIQGLCFAPDGKAVAAGTEVGALQLWSVGTGKSLWKARPQQGEVRAIAFFPDGTKIATGSGDGSVCILDAKTGKTLASFTAHRKTVYQVAVSPDGKYVGSVSWNGFSVWDVENGKTYASEQLNDSVYGLAFSKTHLVISDGTKTQLFDLKTKKLNDAPKPQ
jgi:WD40 repeat protein